MTKTYLAKDLEISIKGVGESYTEIYGLESLTISFSKSDVDVTTFSSDAWEDHIVGTRGFSVKLEGILVVDAVTDEQDAGQKLVDTLALKTGYEARGEFKITFPSKVTYTFTGTVNRADSGGGKADAISWGCEITGCGKPVIA